MANVQQYVRKHIHSTLYYQPWVTYKSYLRLFNSNTITGLQSTDSFSKEKSTLGTTHKLKKNK